MSFYSDSGDERMIALRQRTRSSDGYSRVSSDDDLDDVPTLSAYNSKKVVPKKKTTTYASCCFVFSLFGVIFLSIMAYLLHHETVYIKVSVANANKKQDLVRGVVGAIIMYTVCMLISGYFLISASRSVDIVASPRLDD